ncbi:MAG: PIG-L family deacetylase [Deinococcota bacterium]|jgi:LmbE family N-acetylglucosaminyl deacetylase|nr:PIG-L family deacetylase [Deinococcota bacterium]
MDNSSATPDGTEADSTEVDLLLIVPHPDDEVFGCGGLFSKMAAFGKRVATLTLTRGGSGRTLELCSREELPALREAELRASLEVLGVRDPRLLDFPDGALNKVPEGEVITEIRSVLEELRPKCLVTFPPNGSNGHPDHVATHRFVRAALEASSQRPDRIYYFAAERPYSGPDRERFLSAAMIRAQHLAPTHYVDAHDFIENKIRAMGQYETQARSVLMFMRKFPRRLLFETFHRAEPHYPDDQAPMTVPWL